MRREGIPAAGFRRAAGIRPFVIVLRHDPTLEEIRNET